MDQQSLASNPLSSYWSSAHPVISILDVLEQNSKLSRHDLLKVRFRFITRTLMWDYRYLQIYYWTPIPGTVALRMWKRVDDWIKEKNYKLTPIEEAAYKQSRNRRVPLAAPGLFIPFLTAFAYTFATRRLRWFNYSYWTRWIVTLSPSCEHFALWSIYRFKRFLWYFLTKFCCGVFKATSITITPMWFSFSMGCSMTPFFTLPRDSILGMKFRELYCLLLSLRFIPSFDIALNNRMLWNAQIEGDVPREGECSLALGASWHKHCQVQVVSRSETAARAYHRCQWICSKTSREASHTIMDANKQINK